MVLVALVLTGCGRSDATGGDEARAIAVQFLDELRAGRYEPAWRERTSAEFKSLMGMENLRDYLRSHPVLRSPAEYLEARAIDREGHDLAEFVFLATPPVRRGDKPVPARIRVLLAPGDEGWKVEHLSVE